MVANHIHILPTPLPPLLCRLPTQFRACLKKSGQSLSNVRELARGMQRKRRSGASARRRASTTPYTVPRVARRCDGPLPTVDFRRRAESFGGGRMVFLRAPGSSAFARHRLRVELMPPLRSKPIGGMLLGGVEATPRYLPLAALT